jgi:hypothetical protein
MPTLVPVPRKTIFPVRSAGSGKGAKVMAKMRNGEFGMRNIGGLAV